MYYIFLNDQKQGPFSFKEIVNMRLDRDTPIWTDTYETWIPYSDAKEFQVSDQVAPQPAVKSPTAKAPIVEETPKKFKPTFNQIAIGIGALALLTIAIASISQRTDSVQTDSMGTGAPAISNTPTTESVDSAIYNESTSPSSSSSGDYTAETNTQMNCRENWRDYLTATVMDYTALDFGGIANGYISVENNTPFTVDDILIQVDYIKSAGGIYKTEYVSVSDLKGKSSENVSFPNSDRGARVVANIIQVKANEFNLEYSE